MNDMVRQYFSELGSKRSEVKTQAARRNGRLGGRPRRDGSSGNPTARLSRPSVGPMLKPSGKLV